MRAIAERTGSNLGAPCYLINCAGAIVIQDFVNSDPATWDRVIDINIRGYLNVVHSFLPCMVERGVGHIVNMSSHMERAGWPSMLVYSGTGF